MKFGATLLATASYASMTTVTDVTLPTLMTSGETGISISFGTTGGSWDVLLYGATKSDVDGYYIKLTTSGAYQTMNSTGDGLANFASPSPSGSASPWVGAETGLIVYATDADADFSGQQIQWMLARA